MKPRPIQRKLVILIEFNGTLFISMGLKNDRLTCFGLGSVDLPLNNEPKEECTRIAGTFLDKAIWEDERTINMECQQKILDERFFHMTVYCTAKLQKSAVFF